MSLRILFTLAFATFMIRTARADDWPQWLGPKRDGIWRDARLPSTLSDKTV